MELKHTVKSTIYVDYNDLSCYLGEKIGRSVDIGDSPNDTDYSIKVEKEELDDYDMKEVNNFLESGWMSMEYGYHTILTYCANQGWIDEGDYVIQVSW